MTCIVQKLSFYGEFRLVVAKPDGSYTDTGWIKNIITNDGLERLGNSPETALTFCRVGTGTSPPLITNTRLDAQVAYTSRNNTTTSYSNYTYRVSAEYRFNQGSVIGNITEMGVGWGWEQNNTLWSRALITDSGGNPISLNMTTIDQLTVFYRCTVVGPTNTITGTVNISGVEYSYTARASRMSNPLAYSSERGWRGITDISGRLVRLSWSGSGNTQGAGGNNSVIGTIDGSPTNQQTTDFGSVSQSPYIAGSKYLDNTITIPDNYFNISVGTPSVTGIKTLEIQTGGKPIYQYEFNPIIPKDIQRTLTLSFRFSWDRA